MALWGCCPDRVEEQGPLYSIPFDAVSHKERIQVRNSLLTPWKVAPTGDQSLFSPSHSLVLIRWTDIVEIRAKWIDVDRNTLAFYLTAVHPAGTFATLGEGGLDELCIRSRSERFYV